MSLPHATSDPDRPTLQPVTMHLHTPADPAIARVVANDRCTAGTKSAGIVRHIALDISHTRLAGKFIPGQSFGVIPPGTDPKGRPHKLRLYSLASPSAGEDGDGSVIATTVKRTIDEHWDDHSLFLGVASNYLCDLQIGDEVRLTGPSGKRFVLPQNPADHDFLFIATGTGIAPFRGMMMELADKAPKSRVTLLMGVPYATDLLYHQQLTDLTHAHEHWHYLPALSRHHQDDGTEPQYVHELLRRSAEIALPLLENPRTLIYLCGVAGMELGVFRALANFLPPPALKQFLHIDPETLASDEPWTSRMIHRSIKPTRRVFTEVYA